jgi:hypothetical protein
MMGPNRGVQAGAPGSSYRKSIQSARAMAGARQQYLEAQMGDLERNREAQLASEVGRAGEFARMGAVAQDLSEADWSQRYTRALADQRINQARRQLSLAGLSAGADLASPIVGRILGGLIS